MHEQEEDVPDTDEAWQKTRGFLDAMYDVLQPIFDRKMKKLRDEGVIFDGEYINRHYSDKGGHQKRSDANK